MSTPVRGNAGLLRRQALALLASTSGVALLAACTPASPAASGPTASAPKPTTVSAAKPSGGGATVITSASPAPSPAAQPKKGGVLRTGFVGEPQNLDGVQVGPNFTFTIAQAYERLFAYDVNLNTLPRAAESWEASSDLKQIKFNLRKGNRFHNGREVSSEDVKYSLQRVNDPKLASIAGFTATWATWWTDVQTPDKNTIIVRSELPRPGMLDLFSILTVVDRETLDGPDASRKLNGTGPFAMTEYVQGDHVTMERNKNYWNSDRPHLDGVHTQFFKDPQAHVASLEAGALEVADIPQLRDAARLQKDPKYQVVSQPNVGQFFYYMCNTTLGPTMNKQFRQALSYATDRKRFTDSIVVGFVGEPQDLPWAPQSPAAEPAKNNHYTYDIDKAKALMAQANLTDLDMEIIYATGGFAGEYAQLAQVLQSDFAKLGVKSTIKPVENAVATDMQLKKSYKGIILSASTNGHFSDGSAVFTAGRGIHHDPKFNSTGFDNPRFSSLVTGASIEPDAAKRKAMYSEMNDILLDEAFCVILSRYPQAMITAAKVQNLNYNILLGRDMSEAWFA